MKRRLFLVAAATLGVSAAFMTSVHAESPAKPAGSLPAVFLDRDGTLNVPIVRDGKPFPPQTVEEFRLYPEVPAACTRLAAAGFVLVVATNQPDVGRGDQSIAVVEAMHVKLRQLIRKSPGSKPRLRRAAATRLRTLDASPRQACCWMQRASSGSIFRVRG